MKKLLFFALVIILFACQSPKDKDNVELTNFTRELISLYINDTENGYFMETADEIIVISDTDLSFYQLWVFANISEEYVYCDDSFLGQTKYMGYTVKVHGEENPMIYDVKKKLKGKKRCVPKYIEYDPPVWQICIYKKDNTLCEKKTEKCRYGKDVSDIKKIVEKYWGTSNVP